MNEQQRIVLVDMDGVMADFDSGALANVPSHLITPRNQFYVAHDYADELRLAIKATYETPGFFETLKPMPGLLEAWQMMLDNGYTPRVASAPLSSNRTSVEGKIKWLDRVMVPEFGSKVVEDAIIDADKWKYDGIALIDDRPDVPKGINGQNTAKWEHVLFGWSHLDVVPLATAAFRLLDWRNTTELIKTLNTIAQSVNE